MGPRLKTRPHREDQKGSERKIRFKIPLFKALLHVHEVARRIRSVDETVVVGEGNVDHGTNRDRLGTIRGLHHHRALDDRTDAHDCRLRHVENRGVEERAGGTGVRDGEGRAGELIGTDLRIAGASGKIVDRGCKAGDVLGSGVRDDGNQKASRSVNGDADVLVVEVGDLLLVDPCIDLRVVLEGFGRSLDEEGQEGELRIVSRKEGVL